MLDSESIDRTEPAFIWELAQKYRLLVATVVITFTVLAAAAAFLTTPVYRATVVLLPAETGGSMAGVGAMLGELGGLASIAGIGAAGNQNTVEAVALLKSRDFTESFITELSLLPLLYSDQWDASTSKWRQGWRLSEPTLYDAYQYFSREVRRVSEDKKTGLVTLEIDWTDAAQGAAWANDMVRRINEDMRQRAIAESDASIKLLTDALKSASTLELQEAIARTIETHVKARALANVRTDYAFRVIDPGKPADPDDFIRPQRALYLVSGPIIGVMFSLFFVLSLDFIKRQQRSRTVLRDGTGS
jgi:uncharacterized protein involved in exopolysaccharide biosynthesis